MAVIPSKRVSIISGGITDAIHKGLKTIYETEGL